ncbi:unnamed protein product [Prunus brigantina]
MCSLLTKSTVSKDGVSLFSTKVADGMNFWSFFFKMRRCAITKILNGWKGLDGCVALLTSEQMIDMPNKEPSLGLDSFTSSYSRMCRLCMNVFFFFFFFFVIFGYLSGNEDRAIKVSH